MKLVIAFLLFFIQIQTKPTTNIISFNSAYANSCMPSVMSILSNSTIGAISSVANSPFLQGAWTCTQGVFKGAWEATRGVVVGGAKCIWSPIECAEGAKEAFKNAYKFFSNIVESFSKTFDAISSMPGQEKIDLICSIIGGIGTDVLIAVLTAGVGSGKIALTMGKLTVKFTKIAAMVKYFAGLPMKVIGKLSNKALEKLKLLLSTKDKNRIMKELAQCAI